MSTADHSSTQPPAALPAGVDATLLIVDDDAPLRTRLSRAMERRGFTVIAVESVREGLAAARATPPAYAIIDLRLADGSGLDVVGALRDARPDARLVMLTGYGNIATAVRSEEHTSELQSLMRISYAIFRL